MMFPSSLSSQRSENPEEEGKECESQSRWKKLRKQSPLNKQEQSSCDLIAMEAAHTRPVRSVPGPLYIF